MKIRQLAQRSRTCLLVTLVLAGSFAVEASAAPLQCVPYARDHSGIEIFGNAWTWWEQAQGQYDRGREPIAGAVMAFSRSRAMPLGHVAVVKRVVDVRHLLLDHANWSSPGRVETGVLAEDVSIEGDWSKVRIWNSPAGRLGLRVNPVAGFIYPGGTGFRNAFADLGA